MKKRLYILIILMLSALNTIAEQSQEILIEEVKKLTGEVEMLKYEVRLIKQKLEKLNATPSDLKQQKQQTVEPNKTEPAKIVNKSDDAEEKHQYDLALAELKDKKYDLAREKFADLIKAYPNSSLLDRMLFWYAESFFYQKDFRNAVFNYLQCYNKFPTGQKSQDALLKSAMSLAELNSKVEACQIIAKIESDFTNRSASMNKSIGDLKLKLNCE